MSVKNTNNTYDALVFGYDSHPSSKFAPGPPNLNKVTGIGYTYGNQNGTYFKTAYNSQVVTIPKVGRKTTHSITNYNDYNGGSGVCCEQLFNIGGGSVSPSTVCTYQILYRINNGYTHPNLMYHYEYGPSGYVTEYGLHSDSYREYLGDGWYHAWNQFTTNANTSSVSLYVYVYEYGQYNRFEIGGLQFTQGSSIFRPSQFLGYGENRSNTGALLDLKGSTSISVADVSYNSNGYMYFDGTNDWINLDTFASSMPPNLTVEAVVKFSSMSGNKVVMAHGGNGSNAKGWLLQFENSLGLGFSIMDNPNYGSAYISGGASSSTQYLNQYIHMVGTYDNEFVRFFINGVEMASVEFINGFERQNTFRVGNEVNRSYYMNGEIPVAKIYNRPLSVAEINANYNSYKNIYNLS